MRNMCLLGEVLPNFFFFGTNLKIVNNKAHHIVHHVRHHTIFNGSIILYRMYRVFDTSLLKHSYFCHVFTRESAVTLFHNKTRGSQEPVSFTWL